MIIKKKVYKKVNIMIKKYKFKIKVNRIEILKHFPRKSAKNPLKIKLSHKISKYSRIIKKTYRIREEIFCGNFNFYWGN